MTIPQRREARHFRLWTMKWPGTRPRCSEPMRHRAPQESQSRQYPPAMTIDADRCPTCSGAQLVVLRGNQVPCPTCTPPTRPGDSERYTFSQRRTARQAKASPARRLTILSLGGAALLVAALALFFRLAPVHEVANLLPSQPASPKKGMWHVGRLAVDSVPWGRPRCGQPMSA
jgi:hypothetical protein